MEGVPWPVGLLFLFVIALVVWATAPLPVVQKSVRTGTVVACATAETGWKFQPASTGACDGIETAELEWVP